MSNIQFTQVILHSRKFTLYDLVKFFIAAATNEYKSYRHGVENMEADGLTLVDYSTISKKATDVNYEISKTLFEIIISKCNRQMRRILNLPKQLVAIDSTTVTVGENRLKWAKFKGEKSGIKLHVALNISNCTPQKVVETIAKKHDGPIGEELVDVNSILVEDRAYGKHQRFDMFKEIDQSFVIRIKNNIILSQSRKLKSFVEENSSVVQDMTCYLGTKTKKTQNRFRVVEFTDYHGKSVKVCTDLMDVTPEKIANIYKERWKIETFFKFIKQNLNVKRLFGTTENAVYNQLFISLITYVLLNFTYVETNKNLKYVKLSLVQFIRKLINNTHKVEVYVSINLFLNNMKNKLIDWS
ncbi:IS4 family transposase [Clostridium saccharobutylicum]|nr:IS4 family transposase [Clostridium saccharobutylicum]MBC2413100.1 IS4 family transposase [Clostridium saccharobutylicum]MBC2443026.1 IS4 family transposase [Clostridium saccharobutylicum]MBC2445139.1 IS4 family transposase [Clostridium saccharobutylicum]MBC2449353.1 IS4 family transposase [Clostridium saccharobutylicum]